MTLPRYRATRFERVLAEGRTHPVVLACRSDQPEAHARPMVVKAIGCPEVSREWQLVAEVVGNAIARGCGVATPEPAVVEISQAVTKAVNRSDEVKGCGFAIQPGYAEGCALINIQPYTKAQRLSPEARDQAIKMFLFDLLSQNSERRPEKVNCGLTAGGLVAFDFELCFAHKFVPIIGGVPNPWEPSKSPNLARNHLFRPVVEKNPPTKESVSEMLDKLSASWWQTLANSLPIEWQGEAAKIGEDLRDIADHAEDCCKDIVNRCLI